MTRDDSQSCLPFSEEHSCMAFQSFIACIAWNDSIRGVNNSKVIAEAFIYPYPITGLVGTVAFTFQKMQPRLDSQRNRRWRRLETKPVEIITKHCLLLLTALNDIRATELLL